MHQRSFKRPGGNTKARTNRRSGGEFQAAMVAASAYLVLFAVAALLAALAFEVVAYFTGGERPLGGWGALMVLLLLVPAAFLLARMLALQLTPAYGFEVGAAEAPRLFKLLRHLQKRLGGPRIDRVTVSAGVEVRIEALPRFGFFGICRHHLVIGLPLAFALSGRELAAAIAHEYAHFSPRRSGFAGWINRRHRLFAALAEQAARKAGDGWPDRLLHAALQNSAPYRNAVAFALARRDEYAADDVAAQLVGRARFVSGAVRTALFTRWLAQSFWPTLLAQAEFRERPPFMPYSAMPTALRAGRTELRDVGQLGEAWSENSDLADPHPCLRERVEAQSGACELPGSVRQSAASQFFGPLARELAARFDANWWGAERGAWLRRHRELRSPAGQ